VADEDGAVTGQYVVTRNSPSFFGRNGLRILLPGQPKGCCAPPTLLVRVDGVVVESSLHHTGSYNGVDAFTTYQLVPPAGKIAGTSATVRVDVDDVQLPDERILSTLQPFTPWKSELYAPWSGVVSPDLSQILVAEQGGEVRRFSLLDGHQIGAAVTVDGLAPGPAVWIDNDSYALPVRDHAGHVTTAVVREGQLGLAYPTQFDAAIAPSGVIWAGTALDGRPNNANLTFRTILSTWTAVSTPSAPAAPSRWWLWAGAVAAVVIVVALVGWQIRRRRTG
jgi:hypothetical protein